MSEPCAVRLRVFGLVQGVNYRESLRGEAQSQDVAGWVRNRADGSVEAVLEGPRAAVEAVVAWSRRGPRAARVERIEVAEEPVAGLAGFERRPTA